jgi:hypothetical protein
MRRPVTWHIAIARLRGELHQLTPGSRIGVIVALIQCGLLTPSQARPWLDDGIFRWMP